MNAEESEIDKFDSSLILVNSFALELLKQNSFEDIMWSIAESIGKILQFEDCIIYHLEGELLVQAAAWGVKSPSARSISNPLFIPLGKGIVGTVAKTGVAEIVPDTHSDARYIFDQCNGRSEITVPIEFEKRILGVIDCESTEPDNFDIKDLHLLCSFANIAASRIAHSLTQQELDRSVSELTKSNSSLREEIALRQKAEAELKSNRNNLEALVKERTTALVKSEEQVRLLLDSTAEAICGLDGQGRCTFCNPACIKLLGYSHDTDLLGKKMHLLVHHAHNNGTPYANESGGIFEGFRTGVKSHMTDEILYCADGSTLPVEYWSHPIIRHGEVIGAVVTFLDTSMQQQEEAQRISLENRLRQSQKMEAIGSLAGGIAHDFNNILTGIRGYTELALIESAKGSRVQGYLEAVDAATVRAAELIKEILQFSRTGKGKLEIVGLEGLLRATVKLMRHSIPSSIQIQQHFNSRSSLIFADSAQIHQILLNLCTNAAAAIGQKTGRIEVTLEDFEVTEETRLRLLPLKPGSHIKLIVEDTGSGIDPEVMDRIFEPYFTTKAVGEGTGIGLAIVHSIIDSHAGRIEVQSEPGKGTAFTIYLPKADEDSKLASKPDAAMIYGSGNILVIDDEASITRLFTLTLEYLGYTVTTNNSPLDALEIFKKNSGNFDLVITDMSMPDMTGDILSREILKIQPQQSIILCTGFTNKISEEDALEIGIKQFLMKPVSTATLSEVVHNVLLDTCPTPS